jgi:hypothetical protein
MPNLRSADELSVDVKILKTFGAVLCVAALAVPAGVAAKGPTGNHGKSTEAHGKSQTKSKRCKHTPRVGFNVKGTVVSYDATSNTLVLDVDTNGVSHHAKKFVTADPLTVTGAKVGDPAPKAGDKVVVHGKIDKPKKKCVETDQAMADSVKFTKVTPQDSTETETPEQPEQQKQS